MTGSDNGREQYAISRQRASEIASQFPGRLNDSELEQVAQRVDRLFRAIEEIRKYPLENGDEPAPIFRPIGKEQP